MPESKDTPLAIPGESMLPAIIHKKDTDAIFDVNENMTGVVPQVPKIEILREGQMFRIVGDQQTFPKFSAVIVSHRAGRRYWKKAMGEGANAPPDCFSNNGLVGIPRTLEDGSDLCPIPGHQRARNNERYKNQFICATCPMNAWGSDPKGGRGKGCKERHLLYLLPTDPALASIIPYLLDLPPSCLAAKDKYFTLLTTRGIPHAAIVTNLALKKETNNAGQEYSELMLEADLKRRLSRNDQLLIKGIIDTYQGAFDKASADAMAAAETHTDVEQPDEQAPAAPRAAKAQQEEPHQPESDEGDLPIPF